MWRKKTLIGVLLIIMGEDLFRELMSWGASVVVDVLKEITLGGTSTQKRHIWLWESSEWDKAKGLQLQRKNRGTTLQMGLS